MNDVILLGQGTKIVQMPRREWEENLWGAEERCRGRLRFMTREHHLVRYFVVNELPRHGSPVEPAVISSELGLRPDLVHSILDDLEKRLFFVVRDERGAVSWAFPVTSVETPHRLVFSTGERLYAA